MLKELWYKYDGVRWRQVSVLLNPLLLFIDISCVVSSRNELSHVPSQEHLHFKVGWKSCFSTFPPLPLFLSFLLDEGTCPEGVISERSCWPSQLCTPEWSSHLPSLPHSRKRMPFTNPALSGLQSSYSLHSLVHSFIYSTECLLCARHCRYNGKQTDATIVL